MVIGVSEALPYKPLQRRDLADAAGARVLGSVFVDVRVVKFCVRW